MADFSKYAPATLSELRAQEAGRNAVPASPATVTAPSPAPAPVAAPAAPREPAVVEPPRYIGGKPREKVIPLEFHIKHLGRVYTSITLRRPTSREVGEWFERLIEEAKTDPNGKFHFPIFVDEAGDPIPEAVLDYLDGDDDEAVMGAAGDFLPRRLRVLWADPRPVSPPQAGEPTAPTSSA